MITDSPYPRNCPTCGEGIHELSDDESEARCDRKHSWPIEWPSEPAPAVGERDRAVGLREEARHRRDRATMPTPESAPAPEPPLSWWKGHIKLAADAFTNGDISAGKLGEVLGASDLHGFKAACGAFGESAEPPTPAWRSAFDTARQAVTALTAEVAARAAERDAWKADAEARHRDLYEMRKELDAALARAEQFRQDNDAKAQRITALHREREQARGEAEAARQALAGRKAEMIEWRTAARQARTQLVDIAKHQGWTEYHFASDGRLYQGPPPKSAQPPAPSPEASQQEPTP